MESEFLSERVLRRLEKKRTVSLIDSIVVHIAVDVINSFRRYGWDMNPTEAVDIALEGIGLDDYDRTTVSEIIKEELRW